VIAIDWVTGRSSANDLHSQEAQTRLGRRLNVQSGPHKA
jgi:hypothetical protein